MKLTKRILALVLALVITLSFVACDSKSEKDQEILTQRREIVVAKMLEMTSVLWRADETFTYSKARASEGLENDPVKDRMTIVAGRVYQGLPYTHASGSGEAFMAYMTEPDEKGVYTLTGVTPDHMNGIDGVEMNTRARLGNDCADAVFWAWSMVSSSIDFTMTYYMTEDHGCIKVGEYECNTDEHLATKQDCQDNGIEVMCKAYAQLQPADAVVHRTKGDGSGHAMMVTNVEVVMDGDKIDPYKSYVNVAHQTSDKFKNMRSYYNEELQETVYLICGTDDKVTFQRLFDSGYLPMTCKELIDASPVAEEAVTDSETQATLENIFTGTFTSPYRISSVTITITDKDGKEVQKATCFGREAEMRAFDISRFTNELELLQGSLDLDALAAGDYHCTHTCQIATGKIFTVRDFDFTK